MGAVLVPLRGKRMRSPAKKTPIDLVSVGRFLDWRRCGGAHRPARPRDGPISFGKQQYAQAAFQSVAEMMTGAKSRVLRVAPDEDDGGDPWNEARGEILMKKSRDTPGGLDALWIGVADLLL